MMPPTAASSEPAPKVNEMMRFTSMACRRAASRSVETARMAMPVLRPVHHPEQDRQDQRR